MSKENEIRDLILQGKSPKEIIGLGYKKPTVYKVHGLLKQGVIRETFSQWQIENIRFNKNDRRYQPNQNGTVKFELRNTSDSDLYVYQVGIQPEWLKKEWISINSRILLHPNEKNQYIIKFKIPSNRPLDDYSIRFGFNGQLLYPSAKGVVGEQQLHWSEPVFIDIKMPSTGYQVFISHSVKDIFLIRQIKKYLDCYGIKGIIAQDILEPGSNLEEKFYRVIRESHFFLGIITQNAVSSEWVIKEVNYADKINKPLILLVEEGSNIKTGIEIIPFKKSEPINMILTKISEGLNSIRQNQKINPDIGNVLIPVLIGGLVGLLGGLLITSSLD